MFRYSRPTTRELNKYECTIDQELTSYALGGLRGSRRTLLHVRRQTLHVHSSEYGSILLHEIISWPTWRRLEIITSCQKFDSVNRCSHLLTLSEHHTLSDCNFLNYSSACCTNIVIELLSSSFVSSRTIIIFLAFC